MIDATLYLRQTDHLAEYPQDMRFQDERWGTANPRYQGDAMQRAVLAVTLTAIKNLAGMVDLRDSTSMEKYVQEIRKALKLDEGDSDD